MLNKKQIILFGILAVFFISISSAQEANITIEQYGFGKNEREVYFIFRNTGQIPLENITVFVDGKQYPISKSKIGPGMGVVKSLYLEPGEHLIEIKTLEGAYASLTIKTPFIREIPNVHEKEEKIPTFIERAKVWIILGIFAMIVMILWLLLKKPSIGD